MRPARPRTLTRVTTQRLGPAVRQSWVGLGALANVIHPYPTMAEAIKDLGDAYNRTRLTPFTAGLLKRILRWKR